jgi:hypothetical protein
MFLTAFSYSRMWRALTAATVQRMPACLVVNDVVAFVTSNYLRALYCGLLPLGGFVRLFACFMG